MARVVVSEAAGKLAHIDVLRGIAIVAVVVCHHAIAFPLVLGSELLTSCGRLGVQLFFVASAVTLCRSADRRRAERRALSSFAIRRLARVAPLYWLGLAFYALVRFALPGVVPDGEPTNLYAPTNVLANVLFVHGFLPGAYNHVVPGGWSIAAEMSFYLLFPLLFPAARWLHRAGGVPALAAATAGVWLGGLGVQLLIFRWADVPPDDPFVHSGIANQLPVFLVGMTAWFAVERGGGRRVADDAKWCVLIAALVLLLLLRPIPLVDQIVPVLAATAFLFLLSCVRRMVTRAGLLGRVGQRSYSMYILHFLPVWIVSATVERVAPTSGGMQIMLFLPSLVLTLLVTFAMGGVTERLVERPFIALARRWIARRAGRDSGCIPHTRLYGSALP